ncbi:MAG: acyl-homoserine-lactone synthase [Planktomarina sp.]
MLHFLYADKMGNYPKLFNTMRKDRAAQFRDRLNWDVDVDDQGLEQDQYDQLNPLYVIASDKDGRHAGSLRLLPTVGPTMVNDHFRDVIGGGTVQSPFIWECTRFCIGKNASRATAALLMLGGGVFMKSCGVEQFVGVFDTPMLRIYGAIGSKPEVLGTKDGISVGLWTYTVDAQSKIERRAKVDVGTIKTWLDRDVPGLTPLTDLPKSA